MVRMNALTDAFKGFNNAELTKKTVFLPKSRFPPRHDPKVELTIQEDTKFAHTYLEQNPTRKSYLVHDGPPFANGPIHLGHAINKILKDIAARYAMITGHKVEFITGWDCHGLPIEIQVLKLIEEQQRQSNYGGGLLLESTTSPEHFRTKARSYAKSQIDLQMAGFKRMGLLTDWNKRYTTDDPSYVANQLRAFSQLFEQKLIFKDLMPVHWSLVNKTSVAEADIEHRADHISKSTYILYEIVDPPFIGADIPKQPIHALIWTTTPWTLLENRAIAFNKQETYCIVRAWKPISESETKNLLVSMDTKHKLCNLLQRLGYQFEMITYVPGKSLVGLKYKPLLETLIPSNEDNIAAPRPFLEAEFVDGSKGTGLVHIAPNYGHDDFHLIKKHKLPIQNSLVDHEGRYRKQTGEILAGKFIFSDGTQEILSVLDQQQALFFTELTQHSYPYESRTNQPVITRTSQQIFIDTSRVIPRCLKALEDCSVFPENLRQLFNNTLATSPNWCISRQRIWGTPIPVLYDKEDVNMQKMISHPQLVEHFCRLLYKKRFMDYWWTADNEELVPQELLDKCKLPYKTESLVRGMDIFDVWSDSGLSWHTTTDGLNDNKSQADIYLEGVDQIRGWFSASSVLSMALRGTLPTKRFFLHGFVLDENGRKMSKSIGNVVDPLKLFEQYGVDPVRLWAAKNAGDNQNVCVRSAEFRSSNQEMINKIRLTLKYLIGALGDHDGIDGKLDHTKLETFDQYYLDKLYRFASAIEHNYKNYRFDLVVKGLNKFLVDDLSPIYINTIKDLLYCDEPHSARRKSCLTTLNITYNILLRCLYPITPHIVHEAAEHMRSAEPLNEWTDLAYKAAWKNDVLHEQMETIVKFRGLLHKIMGPKAEGLRDHDCVMTISDKKMFKSLGKIMNSESDLMTELFRTSTFVFSHKEKMTMPEDVVEQVAEVDEDDDLNKKRIPPTRMFNNDINSSKQSAANINSATTVLDDVEDESVALSLLTHWNKESLDDHRLGGSFIINDNKSPPVRFEMCFRKSNNRKCSRCRRFTVLALDEDANFCDRCRQTVQKLNLLD